MSTDGKVRLAVIGTGRWSKLVHTPGIKSHPDAELVAVCSRTKENVEAMAAEFHVPHAITDYREVMKLEGLDGVVVCTTAAWHYPICMEAIGRGLHVFCEKPLGMTLAEAREMHDAAVKAGVKHMVAFTTRFLPHAAFVKQLLDQGQLGRVYLINLSKMAGYAGPAAPMRWRYDKALAGAGVLADLGSHAIDLALWYFGPVKSICADLPTFVSERTDPKTGAMARSDVDDAAALLVKFESGVQGVLHISWVAPKGRSQTLSICGSDGSLVFDSNVDGWEIGLMGSTAEDQTLRPIEVPRDMMAGIDESSKEAGLRSFVTNYPSMSRKFVDVILHDQEPSPSFLDGMKAQEVMDAAMISSAEGRWVDLPLA